MFQLPCTQFVAIMLTHAVLLQSVQFCAFAVRSLQSLLNEPLHKQRQSRLTTGEVTG